MRELRDAFHHVRSGHPACIPPGARGSATSLSSSFIERTEQQAFHRILKCRTIIPYHEAERNTPRIRGSTSSKIPHAHSSHYSHSVPGCPSPPAAAGQGLKSKLTCIL